MDSFFEAVEAFWDSLSSVSPAPLAAGIAIHLLKLACTSRAWWNVLVAAHPTVVVRWRSIFAAYLAGVGGNAVLPARGGDVIRLVLAHRAVPGSSYATLLTSTLVLAILDATLGLCLFFWALTQGVFPSIDALPSLPAFDFAWLFEHDHSVEVILVVAWITAIALAILLRSRIRRLRDRVAQAFTILRTPSRYVRHVVVWQLCDWSLRLVTIWCFLGAFGIEQSVRNVLLVQVTQSMATLVPVSPGGVGTEQAFLLYTLAGQAARSTLLAFSVGMKLVLTAVNVVAGLTAITLTLGTMRWRHSVRGEQMPVPDD